MHSLPSLPADGPLRLLAVAGTVAILAFLAAVIVELVRRRWRDAAWGAVPLVLGVATFLLGHRSPAAHAVVSIVTLAAGLANAVRFRGASRWLEVTALVGWVTSLVCARLLFG